MLVVAWTVLMGLQGLEGIVALNYVFEQPGVRLSSGLAEIIDLVYS